MKNTKKIYILQMYSNTIPSKIIKVLTKYKYSHIAISFDEDCEILYSFGRKNVNSILNGGFTEETKNGEFYTKFNKTICKIFEIEVEEEKYVKVKNIIEDIKKNSEKYKYDYLGIVLRFLKIPITFKNKYVCTYFVADILEKAQIYKFSKKTFFVTPEDFEEINYKKEIYSGKYLLY